MMLQSVIVDDEPLARDLLGLLLADHTDIQVVAKCQNGREAISYIQSKPVDLLFLDVQMPKIDGFDVVEQVGLQHLPPTVFVTAYQEYAVRAFDIHAVDYLTKPVDAERLAEGAWACPGEDCGEGCSPDAGTAYGCVEWVADLDYRTGILSLTVSREGWCEGNPPAGREDWLD
jgi:CheY-like chemotaxis protein